jgi:hypothetical protein
VLAPCRQPWALGLQDLVLLQAHNAQDFLAKEPR